MFDRPGTSVIEDLNSQCGKLLHLPPEFLRHVQEFEKLIDDEIRTNDEEGGVIGTILNCFLKVQILATAYSLDRKYRPLKKCIDDIVKRFGDDESFQDDLLLFSWVFFDFPTVKGGKPIGFEVAETLPELKPFLDGALDSRLGIFEVIKNTSTECHLTELFTGKQWKLSQGLDLPKDTEDSCLVFARPIHAFGEQLIFGNYSLVPAAQRAQIEDLIRKKMKASFFHEDDAISYETFMTLAGPYWFSIFAKDGKNGLLTADHYLQYYKKK
jgi:hypothetical protein